MLTAKAKDKRTGREMLLIGLEPQNIRRLLAGEPVYLRSDHPTMAGLGFEVCILRAEDLAADAERKGAPVVEWKRGHDGDDQDAG